jgi:subtilisin family serine protease
MPVKVLNASGGGTFADTAAGVIWAVNHGAQVINLSLGGTGESTILEDAINYAHNMGAVIVAAAGNAGSNFILYPARYPNVIAVAKTNSANNWDGSNYGPEIDLSAPGASIFSTVIGGYDYKSGSSMSTGFVSGLAAILMGIPDNASPDAIKLQMESTALDIEFTGWDEYTGAGLIQMDAAIQLALQSIIPAGGSGDLPAGGGSRLIQVAPTYTPSPTWTVSSTLPSPESTATLTPEPSSTGFAIETMSNTPTAPTQEKSEVEAQESSEISVYTLPCAGILLILLGIILLLVFRRKQQEL